MDMFEPLHPGIVVKDALIDSTELTVTLAADKLGVSRTALSRLVNGHASISPEMALKLANFFNTSVESWINLQAQYDAWLVNNNNKKTKKQNTKPTVRAKALNIPNNIPLLGRIAAGEPIEAILQHENINLQELLAPRVQRSMFALEVKGDSMLDEGIFPGDLVFCEASETAKNGDIVVALIDNQEATLKRIRYEKNGSITLIPANLAFKPMIYEEHRVKIQGIFVGLIRTNRRR